MEDERVEDLLPSLPRALKVLRESRRLDQDELVRLLAKRDESVGRAAIARYEAGKRFPSLETLRWLMGALDVTWEELGRALVAARMGDTNSFLNDTSSEKPDVSSKLLKPKSAAESRPKKSGKRPRKRERRPEPPDNEEGQNGK